MVFGQRLAPFLIHSYLKFKPFQLCTLACRAGVSNCSLGGALSIWHYHQHFHLRGCWFDHLDLHHSLFYCFMELRPGQQGQMRPDGGLWISRFKIIWH